MIEWQAAIEVGIKAIAPKIIDAALKKSSKSFISLRPYEALKFDKHFKNSFNLCKSMKTIFRGNKGIPLLENYVPPTFPRKIKTMMIFHSLRKYGREKECVCWVRQAQERVCS